MKSNSTSNLKNYLKLREFYKDLTISFSGYNIKEYIELAVESLLYLYPELKENIVVFDDNSTDGTKEYLEKRGIRRITWKYCKEYTVDYHERYGKCTSHWNNIIVREIMLQTDTKYLLVNDGDVVFVDRFLERYYDLITSDRKYKGLFIMGKLSPDLFTDPGLKPLAARLKRYETIYQRFDTPYPQGNLWRVHIFHGLFDLEYFKDINLMFDTIDDPDYIDGLQPKPFLDGGVDFLYNLVAKHINFYKLPYLKDPNSFPVYHFGWRSSLKKYQDVFTDDPISNPEGPVIPNLVSYMDRDLNANEKLKEMLQRFKHIDIHKMIGYKQGEKG